NDLDATSVRVSDLPARLFRLQSISVGDDIPHRGQNRLPRFLNLSPEFFSIRVRLSQTVFCPYTLCRAINVHQEIPGKGRRLFRDEGSRLPHFSLPAAERGPDRPPFALRAVFWRRLIY